MGKLTENIMQWLFFLFNDNFNLIIKLKVFFFKEAFRKNNS